MERLSIMNQIKQCSFRCNEDTWKRFKLLCLFRNISCQDQLSELIEKYVAEKNGRESKRNLQSVSPL